jgi:hypothetical protein
METALVSACIGFLIACVTAALGFAKLINDKESKVSEFRQEWTCSVREALADISGQFLNLLQLKKRFLELSFKCEELSEQLGLPEDVDSNKIALEHYLAIRESHSDQISDALCILRKRDALCRLHFKVNDVDFLHVESKIDCLFALCASYGRGDPNKNLADESEADRLCRDLVQISRGILKSEWERIKNGEVNFQKTKRVFKDGSMILAGALAVILIAGGILKYSDYLAKTKMASYLVIPPLTVVPKDADKTISGDNDQAVKSN